MNAERARQLYHKFQETEYARLVDKLIPEAAEAGSESCRIPPAIQTKEFAGRLMNLGFEIQFGFDSEFNYVSWREKPNANSI